ncbi:signal peptide peptidase SppA [Microcoleus sp. FACHB-1515]|uniref:signal peptide peptidase SppA n=1 Tax=Cyanophyceae TaxID=3028117 RepID=UPI0016884C05|nr:signal peptide peptidase SppA [Microcoleus sp. FACHB-1515]MBD2092688.1 signal peptide peptidase SppA [Microcoleus sp. FACHB-1515]
MRSFFKSVLASFVALLLFVGLGVGGFALLIAALTAIGSSKPAIKDDTILAFDLSLNIADASSTPGVSSLITGSTPNTIALRTVTRAIDQAAKDDRISGLYLSGDLTSGLGWASLRELRQSLEAFRAAGKPIFAYETQGSEREYYLNSVANTVLVNPSGAIEFNGLRSETAYYANALQKFGIGVQILRVGRFKSAVEPFIRPNSSPESRQQTQQLLNDIWGEFLASVGKSRTLTTRQLTTIANTQGLLLADQAVQAGLADDVAHPDEVAAQLRAVTGEDKPDGEEAFRQISVPNYLAAIDPERSSGNRIAVIYAEGNIVDREGGSGQIGGDALAEQIRKLREDDDVKAIVIRVNSPGGSASASDVIAREVKLSADRKPVIISMGDTAASGGYLMSTFATEIFASPNTITGSIGVFGLLPNVQRLANNNGITWDTVETNPFADSQTIARPKTPQELAIGQRVVNQIYDRFVSDVSTGRKLDRNRVNEIAQGRVWSGIQAEKIGLVDQLGGLNAAIQSAADRAKLGEDFEIDSYPRSRSFREQFFRDLFSNQEQGDPFSVELQQLQSQLETLRSLNDPQGTYMRLPINFEID